MKRIQIQGWGRLAAALLLVLVCGGAQGQSLWDDVDRTQADATVSVVLSELKAASQSAEDMESIWLKHETAVRGYGSVGVNSAAALLESDNAMDRFHALWILERIGGAVTLPALLKAASMAGDPFLQQSALRILVEGSGFVEVALLLREMADSETEIATLDYATETLEELRFDRASPRAGLPQTTRQLPPAHGDATAAKRRIRVIVEDAMEASTLRADGRILAVSRAHAAPKHLREVVQMGPDAVPALVEYAWSGSSYEWYVARELLTQSGGVAIVEPLATVVRNHSDSHRRFSALITLIEGTHFRTIARSLHDVGQVYHRILWRSEDPRSSRSSRSPP